MRSFSGVPGSLTFPEILLHFQIYKPIFPFRLFRFAFYLGKLLMSQDDEKAKTEPEKPATYRKPMEAKHNARSQHGTYNASPPLRTK